MEDDIMPSSTSLIEDDNKKNESDELSTLIEEMNSKCVISNTKPFPEFIHATHDSYETDSPKLMATLDACPFPAYNRLMPFPYHAIGQKDTKLREILFNKSMGELASLILFSPIPIFLPPVAAMLTGKVSNISIANLKEQEKRYLDIFNTLYSAAENKDEFLCSEKAKKLRFLHQEMRMTIRNEERRLNNLSFQSWDPIQSSVSIFVFYSKTMDVIRQRHAFVSESDTKEFERYSTLIQTAEENLTRRFSSIMSELTENNPKVTAAMDHMKNHIFSLINEEKFSFDLDKKVNQADHTLVTTEMHHKDPSGFNDLGYHVILNYTVEILAAMEKWLLSVCGIHPKFHNSVSLLRQSFPFTRDVPQSLLKEMNDQLVYIHNTRKDAFASLWSLSATKPVLILPLNHNSEKIRSYLVQIFRALTITRTPYLSIIQRTLQCSEVSAKKVPSHYWNSNTEPLMKWYPDPSSRRQPLSVFSFSHKNDISLTSSSY